MRVCVVEFLPKFFVSLFKGSCGAHFSRPLQIKKCKRTKWLGFFLILFGGLKVGGRVDEK